jgi:long-chain fatty acid transport protein
VATMTTKQVFAVAAALLLVPAMASGAGFALFEHGNRAMGMGGAFTAVADDPSAMYWNPAGLAFQTDKGVQFMGGTTFITASQKFYGDSPYPGDGYAAEQLSQTFYPPHFYLVVPFGDKFVLSGGMMTPYGLGTWWEDDHAGRFISKRVNLQLMNAGATLSYKVNDNLAFGLGVDYGIGSIDLTRTIGFVNPYTQAVADVGQVHLYTEGTSNTGIGYNGSMLVKLPAGLSFGVLYRSKMKVEYEGFGSFTQYPTGYADFDALLGSQIPFHENAKITTEIMFPDFMSLGLAWANEDWTVSLQYGWMGWQSFKELPLTFVDYPYLSEVVEENYSNSSQYRLGAEWRMDDRWAFQAGALRDQTPQPTESMSPLLGDGNRTGVSLGFHYQHGNMWVDVSDLYLWFDGRSTGGASLDGYEGRYDTRANLIGVTLGMSF